MINKKVKAIDISDGLKGEGTVIDKIRDIIEVKEKIPTDQSIVMLTRHIPIDFYLIQQKDGKIFKSKCSDLIKIL